MDPSGNSAVWRSLGGQVAHISFRSVVLGPKTALEGERSHDRDGGGGGGEGSSTVHGAIVQAVRCRFPDLLEGWSSERKAEAGKKGQERRQRRTRWKGLPWSVCILRNPDLITVHHPSGHSYDVTLPCEARLLHPLGEGLLVQRHAGGDEGAPHFSGARREQDGEMEEDDDEEEDAWDASGPVPSLFTLSHPLDELRPVALLPPAVAGARAPTGGNQSGGGGGGIGCSSGARKRDSFPASSPSCFALSAIEEQPQRLVCDASERVVFARGDGAAGRGRDASLLLTYHAGRRRHSLWHMLPVPEPENESERDDGPKDPDSLAGRDVSVLGPMMDASPGGMGSWRPTTGLSSTLGADASSLSSTLLGISALESSSSAAGLTMLDAGLASGQSRRDRLSNGGRSRLSGGGGGGGAGRRVSTGSNTSWVGPGNTRNEALASALGLGHSALGVASNMLSLSAAAGQGGGERGGGMEPFLPSMVGGGLTAGSSMALGESQAREEEEDEEEGKGTEAQRIRPHVGLSLLWREAEDSISPARHVFCAEAGASSGSTSDGSFLVCLVEGDTARLRALSISFPAIQGDSSTRTNGHGDDIDGDSDGDGDVGEGVEVTEAFTMPCISAVGLCATTGGEGEGAPGGAIAADILALTPDRGLVLCRGDTTVTQVSLPEAPAAKATTGAAAVGHTEASRVVVPGQAIRDEPESVSDAVGSCFTLKTRFGHRWRLRLSLDPASPLVSACLGAWDCMLSVSLSASLRADVVGRAHALAKQTEPPAATAGNVDDGVSGVQGSAAGTRGGGGLDLDWEALISVMRNLVAGIDKHPLDHWQNGLAGAGKEGGNAGGEDGGEGGSVNDGGSGSGDGGDDAWNRVMSDPFHDQFSRDHAMMLSGFHGAVESTARKGSRAPQGFARAGVPEVSPPSPSPRPLRTERAAFLAEAGAVFDALHLVLEDLKTSRLTVSLVPRLASLLLSLTRVCGGAGADMRDFSDHYWRDAAGCRQGGGSDGIGGETASMIARGNEGLLMEELGKDALPRRPTRFRKVGVAVG